ncbi:MAG: zf-HC2 domain-containing protein [Candidatus Omnitrophica bacterium]|nr:zf-HC2 domain-containing protein [Candidatus Omnitrophota bacterium]
MDCKRAKGLVLSDYTDGVLRGHALEELELHLRSCSSCRRLAEGVTSTGELLKSAARVDAPQAVWNRIRAEISRILIKEGFVETVLERIRYGLYHLRPTVMATAAIIVLIFVLATARFVSYMNYSAALSVREDIVNMVSLNGEERGSGEYDIGTSAETFFL